MSQRNAIITIIIIVLLILSGLIFFYFNSLNKPTTTPTIPTGSTNIFGTTPGEKTTGTSTSTTGQTTQTGGVKKNLAELIQLFNNPTSGAVIFTNKNNEDVIRFVDRSNGNIYEYIPSTQTGEPVRLTNTTIPKIQEVSWLNTGDILAFRYLEDDTDNIISFLAKLTVGSSSNRETLGEINGAFITPNIKQLVTNPSGNKFFELFSKDKNTGTYGITLSSDGTGRKQVFDSPVLHWNVSWPKENVITLTTKSSYKYPGYLYFYNPQTGVMDRILGDILGLSTITNKDASMVAYSFSKGNSFGLDVYDVKNKTSLNYKISALAEKCVWGINDSSILYCAVPNSITANSYPDAWYQGIVSTSDNIWSINTKTGESKLLYQIGLKENVEIDVIDMKISPSDEYLTFSNKNNLNLWMLQIK